MTNNRFQILALDGGGIKGLFSAAVLTKLEEKLQTRMVDHFDLITGTSTGGLIALGLGLGLSPNELVQFYVNKGSTIFRNSLGWRWCQHWLRRKYPQSPLKKSLMECFGDKRLSDSKKRLIIPAYNIGQDKVRLFKTPHHERLTTDWGIPAWKVGLATSAAPTFFPACQEIADSRLVDGGVWANNPAVLGIAEAVGLLGCRLENVHVFSIGTTDTRKHRTSLLDGGGIFQWVFKKDIIDVLMRGQSAGANGIALHLLGPDNLLRIDPIVPESIYQLDKANAKGLMAEAEDAAMNISPRVRQMFLDHEAEPFTPCFAGKEN
jgi:uncharacterized protein